MTKMLIVDDELHILQELSREFEAKGFEVDTAKDGSDAWARLQDKPGFYDVLLTDLMMPKMDGFDLLQQMRQDTRFQTLPVIVLTAEPSDVESDRLWKTRSLPYLWGDENLEGGKPRGYPFEAYYLTVFKRNRDGILVAVAAALERYPPLQK